MAMAIYNGLTEEYRKSIQYMEEITGKTVTCINMVGGGIQDQLLCELTAKKTGKRVVAWDRWRDPFWATVLYSW